MGIGSIQWQSALHFEFEKLFAFSFAKRDSLVLSWNSASFVVVVYLVIVEGM